MDFTNLTTLGLAALGGIGFLVLFLAFTFRKVVSTNEVHIVQSAKKTTSYGKDTGNGNTYYSWPSWVPVIGVTKIVLPVSNFTLRLDNYEAYDKGRLPFVVDIAAFFRIKDSNMAAKSLSSYADLIKQLEQIVQGAVRSILAASEIQEIMQGRSTFGQQFTNEVKDQLGEWGVEAVKSMELMDIRDHKDSVVIKNIMEKKKSHIEMESRTEVAKNKQTASIAEINAQKEVDLKAQNARQEVGLRTVETEREVALAQQTKLQVIKEQEKLSKEKEMSVLSVEHIRTAEINKQVNIVNAEQVRETTVINARGQKDTSVLIAEGKLEAQRREAEGITLEGTARAEAAKAMELAPVQAQITLAKEIGANKEYQEYLITIRKVEAAQAVGMEQAKALSNADVKVISNTGSPSEGLSGVMDLFSTKGGLALGGALEALSNTEQGAALLSKITPETKSSKAELLNGKAH